MGIKLLGEMFSSWSTFAPATSVPEPFTWSKAEFESIARKAKLIFDGGYTEVAIKILHDLASEESEIIANDSRPQIRKAYRVKENTQSVTLLRGLKKTGILDETFLKLVAIRMGIHDEVAPGHDHTPTLH